MHVLWWMLGVVFYGAGTITESINTLFGYSDLNFRLWYIFGAFLGGAPLAQGTVYLLMKRRPANITAWLLMIVVVVSSVFVMLSPLHPERMEGMRMSGKILEWTFIRYITPFINIYGMVFLVGGAIYSAVKYAGYKVMGTGVIDIDRNSHSQKQEYRARFVGNLFIALGGLLPGIGGSFTKFGYVEVLYVTEFIGMACIYTGYRTIRNSGVSHSLQRVNQAG